MAAISSRDYSSIFFGIGTQMAQLDADTCGSWAQVQVGRSPDGVLASCYLLCVVI